MNRQLVARELVRIVVALLDDYGITDALWEKIEHKIERIKLLYKKNEQEKTDRYLERAKIELGKEKEVFEGKISEIKDGIPDEFNSYKYKIEFSMSDTQKIIQGHYDPQDKSIGFIIYLNGIWKSLELGENEEYIKENPEWRRKIEETIDRIEYRIHHEVIHLVRDVKTHDLEEAEKKLNTDEEYRDKYDDVGHLEFDFEVEAQIHEIARYMKKLSPKKRDTVTFEQLEKIVPPIKRIEKNTEVWRNWINELQREGLLTKAMRDEWGLPASGKVNL